MNLKNEFDLARTRCAGVLDLESNPPVHYTAVKSSTALAEIDRLEKVTKDVLSQQLEEVEGKVEKLKVVDHTLGEYEWTINIGRNNCVSDVLQIIKEQHEANTSL